MEFSFGLVLPGGGVCGCGAVGVVVEGGGEVDDVAEEVVEGVVGFVLLVDEEGGADVASGCVAEDAEVFLCGVFIGGDVVVAVVEDFFGAVDDEAVEGVVDEGCVVDGGEAAEGVVGVGVGVVFCGVAIWVVVVGGVLVEVVVGGVFIVDGGAVVEVVVGVGVVGVGEEVVVFVVGIGEFFFDVVDEGTGGGVSGRVEVVDGVGVVVRFCGGTAREKIVGVRVGRIAVFFFGGVVVCVSVGVCEIFVGDGSEVVGVVGLFDGRFVWEGDGGGSARCVKSFFER